MKRVQPYVWVVTYRYIPGTERRQAVAFDQKESASAFAAAETALGRIVFVTRAKFQSDIDDRVADYEMLVSMGLV